MLHAITMNVLKPFSVLTLFYLSLQVLNSFNFHCFRKLNSGKKNVPVALIDWQQERV